MDTLKALLFVVAQLLGSLMAMTLLVAVFPDSIDALQASAIAPPSGSVWYRVLAMETMLTFILVFTVFTVAFDLVPKPKQRVVHKADDRGLLLYSVGANSATGFAPIIIGFMVSALILVGSSVSGAAFNPARVFGAAVFAKVWQNHWIYWVGGFAGAALAALVRFVYNWSFDGLHVLTEEELQAEYDAQVRRLAAESQQKSV